MKYKIIHKNQFTITGYKKDFTADQAFNDIPRFFNETMTQISDEHRHTNGVYCVTINDEDDLNLLHYYIGFPDNGKDLPSCFFPDGTWVIFPCHGPYPYALQKLNYEIYRDWFVEHADYQLAADTSIEYLSDGDRNDPDYYSELWLPIIKKGPEA